MTSSRPRSFTQIFMIKTNLSKFFDPKPTIFQIDDHLGHIEHPFNFILKSHNVHHLVNKKFN
jgi:hypothetical protein